MTKNSIESAIHRVLSGLVGFGFFLIALFCMWALVNADDPANTTGQLAQSNLDLSGVRNPVTAVLLNFRSFDTLLELAVLFTAAMVLLVFDTLSKGAAETPARVGGSVLHNLIDIVVPLSIVVGVYLLWTGADEPGGAFQAGAVISAATILLRASGSMQRLPVGEATARASMVVGISVFSVVALSLPALNGVTVAFQYPIGHAKTWIIAIEVFATVSITTLLAVYVNKIPQSKKDS